ncbi:MAG: phosphoglycerate dehydrogenase [Anaerolineae bacterium]
MTRLSDCHVLVTATSFGRADQCLRSELEQAVGHVTYNPTGKPLTSAQLADLLSDVDGCIAGLDAFDAAALQHAERLKVIARYGVGTDNVDLEAARARGIIVTNTPTANAVSVAELTVALMLNLARPILAAAEATRRGEWPRTTGMLLEGKCVGLVGLGAIGKQVARRLAGFDCRLLAFDVAADEAFAAAHNIELAPLDRLLGAADFVSLHVPLLPATRGMVDQAFLASMKAGAYLINTSRGELIDEDALYDALCSGHLRGAALDVFNTEPPGADHPFLSLPQVIATPHMGAHSDGAMYAMGRGALDDCLAVLRGESPRYRVV